MTVSLWLKWCNFSFNRRKKLVTSIYYFSLIVFKRFFPWGHYTFTKQQIFGHDQIQSICRRQINVVKMTFSLFIELPVFFLFPQCFVKPSSLGTLKVGIIFILLCKIKMCDVVRVHFVLNIIICVFFCSSTVWFPDNICGCFPIGSIVLFIEQCD